jgi:hypothetical protein
LLYGNSSPVLSDCSAPAKVFYWYAIDTSVLFTVSLLKAAAFQVFSGLSPALRFSPFHCTLLLC